MNSWGRGGIPALVIASIFAGCGDSATGPIAQQIVFIVQPQNTEVDRYLRPTVTVELRDTDGKVAAGYCGEVTLSIGANPNNGTLGGTLTQVVTNGKAAFFDAAIDRPGYSYTLVATAGWLEVESEPFHVVVPSVYVGSAGDGTVTVTDTRDHTVIATIEVGSSPGDIAITPEGRYVYVANAGEATVSVIETTTNSVLATIPVGDEPSGLAVKPDGSQIYVACLSGNGLWVIDVASQTVDTVIELGAPRDIALSPDGETAYVTTGLGLVMLPTRAEAPWDTIPLSLAYYVAASPLGDVIYVARYIDTVWVVEAGSRAVITEVTVSSHRALGRPAFQPGDRFAYVPLHDFIAVVETVQHSWVESIPNGARATYAEFTPGGERAYVPSGDWLAIVETDTRTRWWRVGLGSGPGVAVMPIP